jgi:hypothetical protein
MRQIFEINPELAKLTRERAEKLGISISDFWNIAGQNLLAMSKTGLPEVNQVMNFNWSEK